MVSSTMDVVVVKRRDCVIGSYTVLRTILIAGVLAVLLACAGIVAGVGLSVADGCSGTHGRDNTGQTTGNYNGDGAGRSEKCGAEAAATETPARTCTSTGIFASTLGSAAVFAIAGLILIFSIGRDGGKYE